MADKSVAHHTVYGGTRTAFYTTMITLTVSQSSATINFPLCPTSIPSTFTTLTLSISTTDGAVVIPQTGTPLPTLTLTDVIGVIVSSGIPILTKTLAQQPPPLESNGMTVEELRKLGPGIGGLEQGCASWSCWTMAERTGTAIAVAVVGVMVITLLTWGFCLYRKKKPPVELPSPPRRRRPRLERQISDEEEEVILHVPVPHESENSGEGSVEGTDGAIGTIDDPVQVTSQPNIEPHLPKSSPIPIPPRKQPKSFQGEPVMMVANYPGGLNSKSGPNAKLIRNLKGSGGNKARRGNSVSSEASTLMKILAQEAASGIKYKVELDDDMGAGHEIGSSKHGYYVIESGDRLAPILESKIEEAVHEQSKEPRSGSGPSKTTILATKATEALAPVIEYKIVSKVHGRSEKQVAGAGLSGTSKLTHEALNKLTPAVEDNIEVKIKPHSSKHNHHLDQRASKQHETSRRDEEDAAHEATERFEQEREFLRAQLGQHGPVPSQEKNLLKWLAILPLHLKIVSGLWKMNEPADVLPRHGGTESYLSSTNGFGNTTIVAAAPPPSKTFRARSRRKHSGCKQRHHHREHSKSSASDVLSTPRKARVPKGKSYKEDPAMYTFKSKFLVQHVINPKDAEGKGKEIADPTEDCENDVNSFLAPSEIFTETSLGSIWTQINVDGQKRMTMRHRDEFGR